MPWRTSLACMCSAIARAASAEGGATPSVIRQYKEGVATTNFSIENRGFHGRGGEALLPFRPSIFWHVGGGPVGVGGRVSLEGNRCFSRPPPVRPRPCGRPLDWRRRAFTPSNRCVVRRCTGTKSPGPCSSCQSRRTCRSGSRTTSTRRWHLPRCPGTCGLGPVAAVGRGRDRSAGERGGHAVGRRADSARRAGAGTGRVPAMHGPIGAATPRPTRMPEWGIACGGRDGTGHGIRAPLPLPLPRRT